MFEIYHNWITDIGWRKNSTVYVLVTAEASFRQ
jgi:hypothetical protein